MLAISATILSTRCRKDIYYVAWRCSCIWYWCLLVALISNSSPYQKHWLLFDPNYTKYPKWTKHHTVYPKKYAHGFCFAVLCCGYTLTDFPMSIRLTSLALWQSNDCPSASKATLMNMDKYFMWIHYERLHNHNKAKHDKTVCIFLGIYCSLSVVSHSALTWLRNMYRYCVLQYIPRNLHTVLLCFALLWLCNRSSWIQMKYLSILIRVALLALWQSSDCHSASEVSLMDMGKSVNV